MFSGTSTKALIQPSSSIRSLESNSRPKKAAATSRVRFSPAGAPSSATTRRRSANTSTASRSSACHGSIRGSSTDVDIPAAALPGLLTQDVIQERQNLALIAKEQRCGAVRRGLYAKRQNALQMQCEDPFI